MPRLIYKDRKTQEISFPLGGIGTGCIGLAGNGALVDWEIFNRPNKGSRNGYSHFAIKAESEGKVVDARVLNGDLKPPYIGSLRNPQFIDSYGFGPERSSMAGVPHFKTTRFIGEYPVANIDYIDDSFPGEISMDAFNPFIPLNYKDSSIPGAFFKINVRNTTMKTITFTICMSLSNPHNNTAVRNKYEKRGNIHCIKLDSSYYNNDDPKYGDLTVATDADNISFQEYWFRGIWYESLEVFWREFTAPGKFKNRDYKYHESNYKQDPGIYDTCSLAASVELQPGEKKSVKFVITWNFPNCYNYWNPEKYNGSCCSGSSKTWKNYYATVFDDSLTSAQYAIGQWDRLYYDTMKFKNTLFESTIPEAALDAVSANLSILKSPTCLRLEDGSFYGFEGCYPESGCCEGSCTHVWNYAYALPFLFPELERSMRDLDYRYNQREDGGMGFRLQLPLGRERSQFRPCADGQFGGVLKAYRDWKISGDTVWLKKNWAAIKKSIEFAWAETNEDKWDADKDGVLKGRQHNTLDIELFGPNSWLTGFYLAALKAGSEMAEYLGEEDTAQVYRELFAKGKKWSDENLFNGEYYYQIIDLKEKSILKQFEEKDDTVIKTYWNEEVQEIKYQIGDGCIIDQVIAQWHANLCGLGEIFDKDQTIKSLKSIYKYNFRRAVGKYFNSFRIYSLNDESGVAICEWPVGKYRPVIPIPYASETMSGFEYQAAAHMIQEGMVKEGIEIIEAVRNRYDGEKRNPWNELECGSNYARSMASYAIMNAFSGFEYNMVTGMIGFSPAEVDKNHFSIFWSLNSGWGQFEQLNEKLLLSVKFGSISLNEFRSSLMRNREVKEVTIRGEKVDFTSGNGFVRFNSNITVNIRDVLEVILG